MNAIERRYKIYELAEQDGEFRNMKAAYEQARADFEKFTLTLPDKERNLLHACPGMGYLLHHRLLNIVCEHMTFPEE